MTASPGISVMTHAWLLLTVLAASSPLPEKLPQSQLPPAKLTSDLCGLHYPVATNDAEAQRHFDQGLAYFYSYVWMEAARSFETAATLDPDCTMAWWGLSRAFEKWGGKDAQHKKALEKARDLLTKTNHREQQHVKARLVEFNLSPIPEPTKLVQSGGPETSAHAEPAAPANEGEKQKRRRAAARIIDELLSLHEDDTEAWFAAAQYSDGPARVKCYKAMLRFDPQHPGAHHELVHYYESAKRPALGWPHAEGYLASSPGIPHALHMQAHLATRIGKWDKTCERSIKAVELERAYHHAMGVAPKDDFQFSHHLEVLTLSLVHDGRFREARQIMAEAKGLKYEHRDAWFRLFMGEGDWPAALELATTTRKRDKPLGAYFTALVHLAQKDFARAAVEVEVLRESPKSRSKEGANYRLWETEGLLACGRGSVDEGLRLLERAAQKSKDDYRHHAWGNGAALMEVWGQAALTAGRLVDAEEAFLEALAHDSGNARAALGLQRICEQQQRGDEAERYAVLARKCWSHAEDRNFEKLWQSVCSTAPLRKGEASGSE